MLNNLGSVSLVSALTLCSRVLGLARDILFFSFFGTSAVGAAFLFAFTVPNLFRRMLGDGVLSSAMIPVLSDVFEQEGSKKGFALLNKVLTRLFLCLLPLVVVACFLCWEAGQLGWVENEKWARGLHLLAFTLPYLLLICLTAMIVAALNVKGRFGVGACTPILLNLSMIGIMLWFGREEVAGSVDLDFLALALCGGVLVGGVLQLLAPSLDLGRSEQWRPRLDRSGSDSLGRVWVLFLPGVLGAAVLQVNVLVSRLLAYSLEEEGAISILFLSARLIELPLGVFAIAVSTVVFPLMAKMRSREDVAGHLSAFEQGLRLTLAVTIPAAVGLVVLREPILAFLFGWGTFASDGGVGQTAPVLAIVAMGMPFFATAAFVTRGFHSRKDMKTPVRGAIVSLLVNVVLSVASVLWLGEWAILGLAGANVLAGVFQAIYLWVKFSTMEDRNPFGVRLGLAPILSSSLLLGLAAWGGWEWFVSSLEMGDKGRSAIAVFILIPVSAGLYFLALAKLGFPDASLLRSMLLRPRR